MNKTFNELSIGDEFLFLFTNKKSLEKSIKELENIKPDYVTDKILPNFIETQNFGIIFFSDDELNLTSLTSKDKNDLLFFATSIEGLTNEININSTKSLVE